MDIRQLTFFTTIVDHAYNLTRASKHLRISQPALSQLVREFEEVEQVELFLRHHGRLTGLTDAGQQFYEDALSVLHGHQQMMEHLHERSRVIRGKVRLGIPPVILPVLFSQLIPKLMAEHPGIELEIIEEGAFELKRRLLLEELDLAILIEPGESYGIKRYRLIEDEVVVAVRPSHPLSEAKSVSYRDLSAEPLVILNDSFMLHHQILSQFRLVQVEPQIFFTSGAWDLLIGMVQELDVVSILPEPILRFHHAEDIRILPFDPPMLWDVSLNHLAGIEQRPLVRHVQDYVLHYFKSYWPHPSNRGESVKKNPDQPPLF